MNVIRKFAQWILESDIDGYKREIKYLEENNQILRDDCKGIADLKLRLNVAEMYINDSDAVDELLAAKKNSDSSDNILNSLRNNPSPLGCMNGVGGAVSSLTGSAFGGCL